MGGFQGFGEKAQPFFKALAFHQTRDWFEANRALYESEVKRPMAALIEDLAARFAAEGLPLAGDGRRSLFRLNRDVRFSRDKSPYKTHAGAVMTRSGAKDDPGLLYVHIAPEGCFTAAGFYHLDPSGLLRFRTAIRARPERWRDLVARLASDGLAIDDEEKLTRLPRGFEALKDTPEAEAVRMKNFIVRHDLPDSLIRRPALAAEVAGFARRALPLLEFGWTVLG